MSKKPLYDNPYYTDNVYGHAVELLLRHRPERTEGRVHLDVGCGHARVAEPLVAQFGIHYVGVDGDEDAVAALHGRGLEAHRVWLGDEQSTYNALRSIVGDRQVVSITMLDTLEHLSDEVGDAVLRVLRRLAAEHQAFVVISVPNITHRDIGYKLAFGHWNYTDVGLLDHTHLRLFSRDTLQATLRSAGLHTIDMYDVHHNVSDQWFPQDHPALAQGTMLHELLSRVRGDIDETGSVNQFVRICVPGPSSIAFPYLRTRDEKRPFLSVVTRTQGRRVHTLREVFVCLAGQTDTDFEVLVIGHRMTQEQQHDVERLIEDNPVWLRNKIKLVKVDNGNRTHPINVGFEVALGHYISILDDDDAVMANWVETFRELAVASPGRLLRAVAVRQTVRNVEIGKLPGLRAEGPPEKLYPSSFDLLQHLRVNQSPPVSVAFPRGVFHNLNIRLDESLTTTEDWDYIMRVASLVGVASSEKITSIYRWWQKDESSRTVHSQEEWLQNHHRILQKMDDALILYPSGTAGRIRFLLDEYDRMSAALHQHSINNPTASADFFDASPVRALAPATSMEIENEERLERLQRVNDLLNSTSWRISAPLRMLGRMLGRSDLNRATLPYLSSGELAMLLERLRTSRSWRASAPLRRLRRP